MTNTIGKHFPIELLIRGSSCLQLYSIGCHLWNLRTNLLWLLKISLITLGSAPYKQYWFLLFCVDYSRFLSSKRISCFSVYQTYMYNLFWKDTVGGIVLLFSLNGIIHRGLVERDDTLAWKPVTPIHSFPALVRAGMLFNIAGNKRSSGTYHSSTEIHPDYNWAGEQYVILCSSQVRPSRKPLSFCAFSNETKWLFWFL